MVGVKLNIYCRYMNQLPNKSDQFVRTAMVITCVSMLLEVFGHLYISLISALGYLFYYLQYSLLLLSHVSVVCRPKYIAMSMCLSWQADNGGLFFGSQFGKTPFAHGISPKKTSEGILGAVFLCVLSGLFMCCVAK